MKKVMKKFLPMLLMTAAMLFVCASCGDDDEPNVPTTQTLESVYYAETDARYMFDIDMNKDSSSIYIYNIKFSEQMPVTVNIRIDAPVSVDKTGKVFTYAGTDIVPFLLRGTTPPPMPDYLVTNLTCTVNTAEKTYRIFFNCHGGEFSDSGKLK